MMTITKQSTRSLFDLWQDSRRLLGSVTAYRGREALLRQEARGLTKEAVESLASDPQITQLETALKEVIPLFKANLDLNLFEEWLVGDEPTDGSDTPF